MKNIFVTLVLGAAVISCTQTEIKQTTDTIKQADTLFRSANDGLKTLDSISKVVNDSATFNRVVVPEIEKQKKSVEQVIRENAKSLDSINAVIKKAKDQISKSAEVAKTVDSASKILRESKNPFETISTITKTIDKVVSQTKPKTTVESSTTTPAPQPTPPIQEPQDQTQPTAPATADVQEPEPNYTMDPMVKTAKIHVSVDDLSDARNSLAMQLRNYGGEIVTESFGEEAGYRKQLITAKIPTRYFDQMTVGTSNLGTLRTKTIDSEGKDFDPNQMSDLEITLSENSKYAGNESIAVQDNKKDESFGSKSGSAFLKGFKVLEDVFIALLPFWPIVLIGGLIWYFVRRKRKQKEQNLQSRNYPTDVDSGADEFNSDKN